MARARNSKSGSKPAAPGPKRNLRKPRGFRPLRWLFRWVRRVLFWSACLVFLIIALFTVINPPTTPYMRAEAERLGGVTQRWVPIEDIAPIMQRSAVAAEDANFCLHWGFDVDALRAALAEGAGRGASTISQQVVKNVFLWHGRSWLRKALEAGITPAVELVWSKRRILEVYLNVAEFDEGVFGIEAAAQHYFGVSAARLSAVQAARLAAILPAPKSRNAARPMPGLRARASQILSGAATIRADGRAECFQS